VQDTSHVATTEEGGHLTAEFLKAEDICILIPKKLLEEILLHPGAHAIKVPREDSDVWVSTSALLLTLPTPGTAILHLPC
jgi:hypothetical protein